MPVRPDLRSGQHYEYGLMLAVLAGFTWTLTLFVKLHYLPPPFFFEPADSLMDWFNTAYWAHNRGAYDIWRTVYPPLSFVLMRLIGIPRCYGFSSTYARDCDWLSQFAIVIFYLIDIMLVYLAFKRHIPNAFTRAAAFAFGLPILFTLERGNTILICFAFFVIGNSDLVRNRLARLLSAAITINFKPYLLLTITRFVLKRDWRDFEIALFATAVIYVITIAIIGDGSPWVIIKNTADFVRNNTILSLDQLFFSTSFTPFMIFDTQKLPIRDVLPSGFVDTFLFVIPLVTNISRAAALFCILMSWNQPDALSGSRLTAITLIGYLVGQSPGGYTESFVVFLVFLEPWKRTGPVLAIICSYLICIPADYTLSEFFTRYDNSWLGGQIVYTSFGMTVGIFARPFLLLVILWSLVLDSLALVASQNRKNAPSLKLLRKRDMPA